LFIARGNQGRSAQQFVIDYCRAAITQAPARNSTTSVAYRQSISGYLEQLNRLLALGVKSGDKTIITLSLVNKGQRRVDSVLDILGWKLRRNAQGMAIESGEKTSQAKKQDLSSALAIDQAGMQAAFQAGKTLALEIPCEWASLAVEEATLRSAVPNDKWRGGFLEALAWEPDLARFYIGLSTLDPLTAEALIAGVGIRPLAEKYAGSLYLYASALTVSARWTARRCQLEPPGGSSAHNRDSVLSRLDRQGRRQTSSVLLCAFAA
jgi:hypothetical protein